jgi:hypothetical protein
MQLHRKQEAAVQRRAAVAPPQQVLEPVDGEALVVLLSSSEEEGEEEEEEQVSWVGGWVGKGGKGKGGEGVALAGGRVGVLGPRQRRLLQPCPHGNPYAFRCLACAAGLRRIAG